MRQNVRLKVNSSPVILSCLFLWVFFLRIAAQAENLCGHVIFDGKIPVKFNKNERVLICGKDSSPAWSEIPIQQAEIQIRAVLASAGYANVRFEKKDNALYVYPGKGLKVESWKIENNPPDLKAERKRKVLRNKMTSQLLDEIDAWSISTLKNSGFPCPKVDIQADPSTQHILVDVEAGPQQNVVSLEREGDSDLHEAALERYQAFKVGQRFNQMKLDLTNNRLLADGLVQSSYFTTKCAPEGAKVTHHIDVGKPKLFRYGIGGKTEELPFLEALWKNSLVDGYGSNIALGGYFSNRTQQVTGTSEYYLFNFSRRFYLGPRFRFQRDNLPAVENIVFEGGGDVGYVNDDSLWRYRISGGPLYRYEVTPRGSGANQVGYLAYAATLGIFDHIYESNMANQTQGRIFSASFMGQSAGLGSPISAKILTLKGKWISNFRDYVPPLFAFAFRGQLSSTITQTALDESNRTSLPKSYRQYLGGDATLRGFPLQGINNKTLGYLTSAYFGVEARLIHEIPYQIEPLVLFDVAFMGRDPLVFDKPIYYSPGGGVRWMSPFGPVRLVAARGRVLQADSSIEMPRTDWMFVGSFGNEF